MATHWDRYWLTRAAAAAAVQPHTHMSMFKATIFITTVKAPSPTSYTRILQSPKAWDQDPYSYTTQPDSVRSGSIPGADFAALVELPAACVVAVAVAPLRHHPAWQRAQNALQTCQQRCERVILRKLSEHADAAAAKQRKSLAVVCMQPMLM